MKSFLKKAYDTLYWNLQYTTSYCSVAGLGNGLGNLNEEISFTEGFGQGYLNHFPLSFTFSFGYPLVFEQLKKTAHFRLYANLYQAGITSLVLLGHYLLGTENPLETMIPMMAISFPMVNQHVSETLEERVTS